jgi:high-affinity Fe2+/Pb2+ permease
MEMKREIRKEDLRKIENDKIEKENEAKKKFEISKEDKKEMIKYAMGGFAATFGCAFIGGFIIGIASAIANNNK